MLQSSKRDALSSPAASISLDSDRPSHPRWPFLRAFQNELSPNQANVTVQQIAIAKRLLPEPPAWYFSYSLNVALAKPRAKMRKISPVTSSHSWCAARPRDRPVVRTPLITALKVRLRPACSPATRATTPNLRNVETLLTASILTAFGATMAQRRETSEPFPRRWHLKI